MLHLFYINDHYYWAWDTIDLGAVIVTLMYYLDYQTNNRDRYCMQLVYRKVNNFCSMSHNCSFKIEILLPIIQSDNYCIVDTQLHNNNQNRDI